MRTFQNRSLPRFLAAAIAAAVVSGFGLSALAADAVLVQGQGIAITAADMQGDAQRIPVEARSQVLSNPATVTQIANNLYVRRALAAQAQKDGLEADPAIAAALIIARDKVLSDAALARIDQASTPTQAALDAQARDTYRAKPERFKMPEQVRASHILILGKTEESKAKAEQVLKDLKAGADFATLAKERSGDPGSAAKGGDLGTFARGRMVPEFDEAAFNLKNPGDLSGVIETQFGYHVLRLDERKPAGQRPFEEVRESLRSEALATLTQNARVAAAEKLQKGATANQPAIEAFAAEYGAQSKTGAQPAAKAP